MRRVRWAWLLLLVLGAALVAHADGRSPEAVARALAEGLGKGDFAAATADFAPKIAASLTPAKLKEGWEQATAKAGSYRGIARAMTYPDTVVVTMQFDNGTIEVAVRLDGGKVVALRTGGLDTWQPPAYADPTKVTCSDVAVGPPARALPGTLCMPKELGKAGAPLVLFVHGSGPGDRDESLGQMKPFRDLALGLGARGVATLRWDKRTHGHVAALGVKGEDVTVKEEYLDDVLMAAAHARTLPHIDAKRIFVLGHSMGGWLTPWFLENDPALAGGILLAGNARQLAASLPAQLRYIAMLDGDLSVMEKLGLGVVEEQVKRAMDPKLAPDTPPGQLPLGIAAKYWLSLQKYDAPARIAKIDRPLLILQGARDYQVTVDEDLALWKQALQGQIARKTATFKVYPKANHAFVAGEGKITPKEYEGGGHVLPEVIDDIAAWVKPR